MEFFCVNISYERTWSVLGVATWVREQYPAAIDRAVVHASAIHHNHALINLHNANPILQVRISYPIDFQSFY